MSSDMVSELESKGLNIPSILGQIAKGLDVRQAIREILVEIARYNPKYVENTLIPKYYNEVIAMLKEHAESPLHELVAVGRKLSLDENWMAATLSILLIEIAVRRKCQDCGISLQISDDRGRKRWKNAGELLEDLQKKIPKKGPSILRIVKTYTEEYRNELVHGGHPAKREEALALLGLLKNLLEIL